MKTYSMQDAAKKFGINPRSYWGMVRGVKKILPAPRIKKGRRWVYDLTGLEGVEKALEIAWADGETELGMSFATTLVRGAE
jgi:hypothetical protein